MGIQVLQNHLRRATYANIFLQSIMQALQYWQALQDMSMYNKLVTDASPLLLHIP